MRSVCSLVCLGLALLLPVQASAQRGVGSSLQLAEGAHRVSGQLVAAEDGVGLAGVRVVLRSRPWAGDPLPEPWVPADTLGEPLGVLLTGPDGVFELGGLAVGDYELQPKLVHAPALPFSTSAESPQSLRLELPAGRKVEVSVAAAGGPISGAVLLVVGYEHLDTGRLETASELRRYPPVSLSAPEQVVRGLPEGVLWLQAWHEDWGYSAARPVRLVGDPAVSVPVSLLLEGPSLALELSAAPPSSSYVGVGFHMARDRGRAPRVERVFPASPGARAGLRAGDRVLSIDGRDTRWMRSAEFVQRTRGTAGTRLQLMLEREGTELPLEITRAQVEVPE